MSQILHQIYLCLNNSFFIWNSDFIWESFFFFLNLVTVLLTHQNGWLSKIAPPLKSVFFFDLTGSESEGRDKLTRLPGNKRSINIVDNQWEARGGRRKWESSSEEEGLQTPSASNLEWFFLATVQISVTFQAFPTPLAPPQPTVSVAPPFCTVAMSNGVRALQWIIQNTFCGHFQRLGGFWEVTWPLVVLGSFTTTQDLLNPSDQV